ncbi:TetR family transcriptional regulator [Allosaccharopolyspora coralli]|uniref:TetR family transcriptional regulator n=1 Tax=Allosaccharopolyspora coralli TaxID=2665642 RepID=A0A5Q3QAV5_9PSEU|nr:TetR/AcrR family transcriptional regulator [Allosaccharopolyspora coralli]QGK70496.1 TetR family transcriptional regulator [Allosaccharopolyspora coralli]
MSASEAVRTRVRDSEPEEALSRRVLDAALGAFEENGIQRTTMHGIARRAGLGRATVYRRYPDKDAMVSAVLLREVRRFLETVDEAVGRFTDPAEQIVETYVVVMTGLRGHRLLNRLLTHDTRDVLPSMTVHAGTILAIGRDFLAEKLRAHRRAGRLPVVDPDVTAEVYVRLVHSMLLTPDGGIPDTGDERSRAFARRQLVPLLGN